MPFALKDDQADNARARRGLAPIALLCAAVCVLASCGAEERAESAGGAAGKRPGQGVVHLRTISGGKQPFGTVVSLAADSLDRVFVADQMAGTIEVFDSAGAQVAEYGGKGNGPGEFQFLTSVGLDGEDLVALDRHLGRLTVWRSDGGVATREWPSDSLGAPGGFLTGDAGLYLVGQVRRGPPVVYYTTPPVENTTPRPEIRYALFHARGTLEALPALRDTAVDAEGPRCHSPGHLVGLRAFFPTGPLRAFLPGHELAMASTERFRIDVVDAITGDTARTILEDYPPIPVTDRVWERAAREFRETENRYGAFTNCRLDDLRPSVRPPIRAAFSDDTGRLWAEIPTPEGFDAVVFKDGQLIARFPFPRRDARVAPVVARGKLYVVSVDDLGVQAVEVYRVDFDPTPRGG